MIYLYSILAVPLFLLFINKFILKKKSSKNVYQEVPNMLKGLAIFAHLFRLLKLIWKKNKFPPAVYVMEGLMGMNKLCEGEGVFQVSAGPARAYLLTKARTVEQLLKNTSFLNKPREYRFLDTWLGQGLITSEASIWRRHRKMLTPSFHFKILGQFQPIINDKAAILAKLFAKHLDGKPFEINGMISRCTLDVICETAMGCNINSQCDMDSSYLHAIDNMFAIVYQRMIKVYLRNDFIFKYSPDGRRFFESAKIVDKFVSEIISERKAEYLRKQSENPQNEETVKQKPFLDLLLIEHINGGDLSEQDIKDEVNTFMVAGQDTTAVSLTWAVFLIGQNKDIQNRIAEELDQVLADIEDDEITLEHCKNMKYLECVIKESLRLYPAVPLVARKLESDLIIDDKLLKKGSQCHAFILALHRDPKVFPNPDLFNPDRFLPENCSGRHPYAFVPFSAGPRNCIGQKYAMIELKTILAHIFKNYVVSSIDDIGDVPILPEIVSRPASPIKITIKLR